VRISDTVALTQDCISRDRDGTRCLRYLNHRMKREALVPMDEELERAIAELYRSLWAQGSASQSIAPEPGPSLKSRAMVLMSASQLDSLRRLRFKEKRDGLF
jgi:hypothetical protein